MTQFIKPQNGGGQGGGGTGDMLKSVYDPNNVEANAFDYDNFINTPEIPAAQVQSDWNEADNTQVDYIKNKPDLSGYQTTANLVTDLDDADNTHYPSSLAVKNAITSAGGGDVTGPNSSTDGDIALFDGNTGKIIKDGSKALSDLVQTSGNQTINGTKTYTTSPVVPSKTADATNTGTAIATEAQVYKKQDKLTTQTAYTAQGTASKVPQITTNTLGQVTGITEVSISYPSQVDNTAYGDSWDGITTTAPSKNAVYDKIDSIDELIPSAATSSNQLTDKNYVDDSINSVTAYYITKNAAGDQFATHAELTAATTFYSGGVVRVPTRNDYTIVLADEDHDNATTRYIYNSGWEYQYTVNETALTTAQLNALNSGITAAKVTTYDGYASGKQDTLSTQTAYTTKGSATKVPQITTNTLGQVTGITEVTITHPSQVSDTAYGSSWDGVTATAPSQNAVYDKISAMDTTISGKQNALSTQTAYTTKGTSTKVPTISTNTLGQVTAITETSIDFPVTSVNGSTGAVTVSEFTPSGTATTGYVVTKTAGGYEWAAPSGGIGISTDANNILTSGASIWVGTESNYQNLAVKNSNTIYLTI